MGAAVPRCEVNACNCDEKSPPSYVGINVWLTTQNDWLIDLLMNFSENTAEHGPSKIC